MAGGYERVRPRALLRDRNEQVNGANINPQVNAQDDDDQVTTPIESRLNPLPHSPPPSFHSRASSPTRRNHVDPDLADAFDDPDDDSDDEADDRQRLVRQNSTLTVSSSAQPDSGRPEAPIATASNNAPSSSRRVMGGGVGSDGVFANLSARPERGVSDSEKDEMPPVSRRRSLR